eukprot:Lithocolla_globosa_v1_NODE_1114_length_2859_cov_12.203281.p2 type:complete len:206 gc:universal NODE_1114_length_2859_cov_12.203281:671-54(-)
MSNNSIAALAPPHQKFQDFIRAQQRDNSFNQNYNRNSRNRPNSRYSSSNFSTSSSTSSQLSVRNDRSVLNPKKLSPQPLKEKSSKVTEEKKFRTYLMKESNLRQELYTLFQLLFDNSKITLGDPIVERMCETEGSYTLLNIQDAVSRIYVFNELLKIAKKQLSELVAWSMGETSRRDLEQDVSDSGSTHSSRWAQPTFSNISSLG